MKRIAAFLALISIASLLCGFQQSGVPIMGSTRAPAAGGGTPTFVASWAGAGNQCLSVTTCSLTIAPSAGHTLRVLAVYRSDQGSITTIKDSANNTLSSIYNVTNIGTHYGQLDFCESGIPGGLTAITFTYSAAAVNPEFLVYELSNVGCTADGVSNNTSGGNSPVSSPSITPTATDAVGIIASIIDPGNAAITCTAGTGYANLVQTGTSNDGAMVCGEFQGVASASGSYAANFTYTLAATGTNANLAATK